LQFIFRSDTNIIHVAAYRTEMHRTLATILYIDTINFNLSRYPTFMCKYKYYNVTISDSNEPILSSEDVE
jgi:hypothetical protein